MSADRLLQAAQDASLEGIVSKHVDSVYEPGRRSSRWIKRPLRRTTDAVVVGWTPGSGANTRFFGSLVVAGHDSQGSLRCTGCVGTGFSFAARRTLRNALDQITRETSPLDARAPAAAAAGCWLGFCG
ncbi:ATP-dependent DNA ligase [Nocardia brevicatena]|uniref:ATP dependent DNA ligase n=1 Tax=Nocardia brevicatena TaxID=37327 RepID=UPI0006840F92|nr:hypothetical protein [Nocardia brevicatena]